MNLMRRKSINLELIKENKHLIKELAEKDGEIG